MLTHILFISILVYGTAAQREAQQLKGLGKGLLGAGASVCFIAAGVLGYLLWRKLKAHSNRSSTAQLSSPQQLEASDISLKALARARDSVTVAKKRQCGSSACGLAPAGSIPSDVEQGIRAHYSKYNTAAENSSDSPTSSTSGSSSAHGMPCVTFAEVTAAERQRLRAENIMDSVVIAHRRSTSSRGAATLACDEEAAASATAGTCQLERENVPTDSDYLAQRIATVSPSDLRTQSNPVYPAVRQEHMGLQGEPYGPANSSGKPTADPISRDGQTRSGAAELSKHVQFGDVVNGSAGEQKW